MKILGICGGIRIGNWDSAAALVVDGKVVAAAEEERFTRVKHAPGNLPTRAINYCLEAGGLDIHDIDAVVFPGRTYKNMVARLTEYFKFAHGHAPKIVLCDHHEAHAASCFYTSGLKESLVVTFDFSGDNSSTTIWQGRGNRMELLRRWEFPQSFGFFYALITQHLGFDFGEDEYKVMGLASYGKATMDLSWLLSQDGDDYKLAPEILRTTTVQGEPPFSPQERLYAAGLESRLGPPRAKNRKVEPVHENLAASAQRQLEITVEGLIRTWARKHGARNLCLAGGVAMNCVMNQKLAENGDFDTVFVSPVSGDCGLAMGAALIYHAANSSVAIEKLPSAALGPEYDADEIRKSLDEVGARYREVADPVSAAADAIAAGRIIGWYQGRMEYGARALGHRSILADPRIAEMKDRVNAVVKFREGFRPFAPSVVYENASNYFEKLYESPFMTATFTVVPSMHKTIPAVTHVDGTARVQTVAKATEPEYHALISAVGKRTGVPVVLNTSFNIKGQPIVENPNQAISTFFGSGLQTLVAGPFVVEKAG
jgi:carbamoyltransferase